jgi:uncharacterized metal-binding protein YceD (DUF177 family)
MDKPIDDMVDLDLPFGEGEMSHVLRADEVPPTGKNVKLRADAATLQALAARFSVEEVAALEADIMLTPLDRNCLQARGEMRGRVRQTCGVTLEPVWTDIARAIEAEFQPAAMAAAFIEPEDDMDAEAPEAMQEGEADIGEWVTQIFALDVPSYPRAPGVEFDGYGQTEAEITAEDKKPSPFAALAALKHDTDKT